MTLGAAVAINSVIFDDTSLTGGFNGIDVPSPRIFGYSLDGIIHPFRYAMLALLVLVLCVLGVAWLRRSRLGLRMLAVRDNERAAAAEGVNVMRIKLLAFAIACVPGAAWPAPCSATCTATCRSTPTPRSRR